MVVSVFWALKIYVCFCFCRQDFVVTRNLAKPGGWTRRPVASESCRRPLFRRVGRASSRIMADLDPHSQAQFATIVDLLGSSRLSSLAFILSYRALHGPRLSNLVCTKKMGRDILWSLTINLSTASLAPFCLHFRRKNTQITATILQVVNGKRRCSATRKMAIMTKKKKRRRRLLPDPQWYRACHRGCTYTPRTPSTAAEAGNESLLRTRRRPLPPRPGRVCFLLRANTGPERRESTSGVGRKWLASRARAASPAETATALAWWWLPVWEKSKECLELEGGGTAAPHRAGNRVAAYPRQQWCGAFWMGRRPVDQGVPRWEVCGGLWSVEWTTGAAVPLEITVVLVVPSLRKGAIPHPYRDVFFRTS